MLQRESPLVDGLTLAYGTHDAGLDPMVRRVSDVRTSTIRKLGTGHQLVTKNLAPILLHVVAHVPGVHRIMGGIPLEACFILDPDGNPVPAPDLETWARVNDDIEARRVGLTHFSDRTKLSTLFLGINHGRTKKRPLHFETIDEDGNILRFMTWREAFEAHQRLVEEYLLGHPEVSVRKNDLREKPALPERRTAWERLRYEGKDRF